MSETRAATILISIVDCRSKYVCKYSCRCRVRVGVVKHKCYDINAIYNAFFYKCSDSIINFLTTLYSISVKNCRAFVRRLEFSCYLDCYGLQDFKMTCCFFLFFLFLFFFSLPSHVTVFPNDSS